MAALDLSVISPFLNISRPMVNAICSLAGSSSTASLSRENLKYLGLNDLQLEWIEARCGAAASAPAIWTVIFPFLKRFGLLSQHPGDTELEVSAHRAV